MKDALKTKSMTLFVELGIDVDKVAHLYNFEEESPVGQFIRAVIMLHINRLHETNQPIVHAEHKGVLLLVLLLEKTMIEWCDKCPFPSESWQDIPKKGYPIEQNFFMI